MADEGKQGKAVVVHKPNDFINNPITHLQAKFKDFKELENGFNAWLAKQSLPVEAAVATLRNAVLGANIGYTVETLDKLILNKDVSSASLNPQTTALANGSLLEARNCAVLMGVNVGLSCVMKRLKGKEDVQTRLAAFGAGVALSLVMDMGARKKAAKVVASCIMSGVLCGLVEGGLFKLRVKFSQPPVEDVYSETRAMLSRLGLQNYEKNFKKGLLSDSTLPLLTDRVLGYNLPLIVIRRSANGGL